MGYRNNCASDLPNLDSLLMIITFIIIMSFCAAIHLDDYRDKRHAEKWQHLLDREHMGSLRPYDWELENN
jgi:hypothetical protein